MKSILSEVERVVGPGLVRCVRFFSLIDLRGGAVYNGGGPRSSHTY